MLDQAAQIFDLTGVAGVAVDDAGETDAESRQWIVSRFVEDAVQVCVRDGSPNNLWFGRTLRRGRRATGFCL